MGNVLKRYNGTSWEAVGGAVVGTVNEYTESSSQAYACDYVNDLQTYSTTEQRVGTWIDGKPIYRMVIEGTINSTGISQYILQNTSIETLIDAGGIIIDGNIQFMIGKATYDSGTTLTNASRIIKLGSDLRLDYSAVFRSKPYKAIIEYTKTTD